MTTVDKLGGGSLYDCSCYGRAAGIIKERVANGGVIVVSAMGEDQSRGFGKITRLLHRVGNTSHRGGDVSELVREFKSRHDEVIAGYGLEEKILDETHNRLREEIGDKERTLPEYLDAIEPLGEVANTILLAEICRKSGINAVYVHSGDLGMVTDANFRFAEPLPIAYHRIGVNLAEMEDCVCFTTGYAGITEDGRPTTLGNGGSDYSATIIANAKGANVVRLWKNVKGIYTATPKIVGSAAKVVEEMSYDEAAQIGYGGEEVLHPGTIGPAEKKGIEIRICNAFEPEAPGTRITAARTFIDHVVKLISVKKIYALDVKSRRMYNRAGYLKALLEIVGRYGKSIDVAPMDTIDISAIFDTKEDLEEIADEVRNFDPEATVKIHSDKSTLAIIGEGMVDKTGVSGRFFTVLGNNGINVAGISQALSQINITAIIETADLEKAVRALHKEYFE